MVKLNVIPLVQNFRSEHYFYGFQVSVTLDLKELEEKVPKNLKQIKSEVLKQLENTINQSLSKITSSQTTGSIGDYFVFAVSPNQDKKKIEFLLGKSLNQDYLELIKEQEDTEIVMVMKKSIPQFIMSIVDEFGEIINGYLTDDNFKKFLSNYNNSDISKSVIKPGFQIDFYELKETCVVPFVVDMIDIQEQSNMVTFTIALIDNVMFKFNEPVFECVK